MGNEGNKAFESELFEVVQTTMDFCGNVTQAVGMVCAEHGRDPDTYIVVGIVLAAMTDYNAKKMGETL